MRTLALLLALAGCALAQYGGRQGRSQQGGRGSRGASQTEKPGDPNAPLGTFYGVVKGAGAKTLSIQEAEEHTVVFYCSKKTSYFDREAKIKPADLKAGDPVSVDARLLPDGKLQAVNVRLEHPKPGKESGDLK